MEISLKRRVFFEKSDIFYKVWSEDFKVDESESQDGFSNFVDLRISLEKRYFFSKLFLYYCKGKT